MLPVEQDLINVFHQLYYDRKLHTWGDTRWLGVPVQKCPLDLWIYQEIVYEIRPDLIIECGTAEGGSALYLASLCDLLDSGAIVTIDVDARADRPCHPRITYLLGSSTAPEVFAQVQSLAVGAKTVMVILDSDHHCSHVLAELRTYHALVTVGSYLIVEDTNLNGHPVAPEFGPGPREAVELFLADNADFIRDESREKFILTANAGGILRWRDSL